MKPTRGFLESKGAKLVMFREADWADVYLLNGHYWFVTSSLGASYRQSEDRVFDIDPVHARPSITKSLEQLATALERGDAVTVTAVRRVETWHGPMFARETKQMTLEELRHQPEAPDDPA